MPETILNSTPETSAVATPTYSEPTSSQGTVPVSGDAGNGQSAPTDETFTRIDPNTLPPQLRSYYDNMLRDYKSKTISLAETIKRETAKAAEAYKQKAEFYDQVSTQEEFVKRWNAYVQEVNEAQAKAANANQPDPTAKLEKELAMLKTEVMKTSAYDAIDTFAAMTDDKGNRLHGDFDKLNSIVVSEIEENGVKRPMTMLEVAINSSGGNTFQEKLANGYKAAKSVYDAIFEEGKKAGMGRLQNKMAYSTTPPSVTAPVSGIARRPKNALEALQFARQGLAPSKE